MGLWLMWSWLGCTEPGTSAVERDDALVESMTKLEESMSAVRDAIVRGDLALARQRAAEIAAAQKDPPPPGPEGASQAFRLALSEISGAKTLPEAAAGLAKTVQTCASCHQASAVATADRPPWKVRAAPAEMARHAMDIDRLWMALIEPSEEGLKAAVKDLESAATSPAATGIDLRLRELGTALRDAPKDQRAQSFATLLSACAECHSAGKPRSRPKLAGVTLPAIADTMDDHFVRLVELELAVMGGDLADVRNAATAIATTPLDPTLPEQARPFFDEIRTSAKRAAGASTLPEAAKATAAIMTGCSKCHIATGGGPKDSIGTAPDAGHMARHVFGAYWMTYGLFAPDERAWVGGTEALLKAPLLPDKWSPPPGSAPLDKEIHTIAEAAKVAVETAAREAVLGDLLAACAPCHQQLPR